MKKGIKLILPVFLALFFFMSCATPQFTGQDNSTKKDTNKTIKTDEKDFLAELQESSGLRELSEEEIKALRKPLNINLKGISTRSGFPYFPVRLDNSTNKYFRPVFLQTGGSCGQASGIGYLYTYEMNVLRDLDASIESNQYPTHFTYNFLNGGKQLGSWYFDGWEIIQNIGCPTVETYGGLAHPKGKYYLMDGYDKYYSGMTNSNIEYFTIDVNTEEGLNTLKQWFLDHGNGSHVGGVANFATGMSYTQVKYATLTQESSGAGKEVITQFGSVMNHAMTFVGYDDEVVYDYNGDGQYTNNIDINNDGIVNMKDWEKGALILVNSWGNTWKNQGKVYAMYKLLAEPQENGGIYTNRVYVLRASEKSSPKATAKISLTHSDRSKIDNELIVKVTQNGQKFEKNYFFQNMNSGNYTIGGGSYWNSSKNEYVNDMNNTPVEFGFDITEIFEKIDLSKPAEFTLSIKESEDLVNSSTASEGQIISFSIIDYTTNTEFSGPQNTDIKNNTVTTVSLTREANGEKQLVSTYPEMNFRGTPNEWASSAMTLVDDYIWQIEVTFGGSSDERFKFDVHGDWNVNFGDNNNDNYADQTGNDIFVTPNTSYIIQFNDKTMKYTLTQSTPSYNAIFKFSESSTNSPVESISVTLTSENGSESIIKSNKNGIATFKKLAAGHYNFIIVSNYSYKFSNGKNVKTGSLTIDNLTVENSYSLIYKNANFYVNYNIEDFPTSKIIGKKIVLYKDGFKFSTYTVGSYYGSAYTHITGLEIGSYTLKFDNEIEDVRYTGSTDFILNMNTPSITIDMNISEYRENLKSTYSTMNFRGTPNEWASSAMTLVDDYVWQIEVTFGGSSDERFKFDTHGDWSQNFGDNNNDWYADQNGSDIIATPNTTYIIRFNDSTKKYSIITKY